MPSLLWSKKCNSKIKVLMQRHNSENQLINILYMSPESGRSSNQSKRLLLADISPNFLVSQLLPFIDSSFWFCRLLQKQIYACTSFGYCSKWVSYGIFHIISICVIIIWFNLRFLLGWANLSPKTQLMVPMAIKPEIN